MEYRRSNIVIHSVTVYRAVAAPLCCCCWEGRGNVSLCACVRVCVAPSHSLFISAWCAEGVERRWAAGLEIWARNRPRLWHRWVFSLLLHGFGFPLMCFFFFSPETWSASATPSSGGTQEPACRIYSLFICHQVHFPVAPNIQKYSTHLWRTWSQA